MPNPQRARLRQLGAFPNSVATRRGVAALPLYPHWLRTTSASWKLRRLLSPSNSLFECSLSLSFSFSWKQDGKERKRSNKSIWDSACARPWTVARLRAWAMHQCRCCCRAARWRTNYSDTPATTSIRWNVKFPVLYNFGITYIHLFFFFFFFPHEKRQSECPLCVCILRSVLTPSVVSFENRSSQLSCRYIISTSPI